MNLLNAALILGAVQGIILATLLAAKRRGNRTANRILAGIIYLFCFSTLLHVLSHTGIIALQGNHKILISLFSVLHGPLLYFYAKALTVYHFQWQKKDLLHFIPFGSAVVLSLLLLLSIFPGGIRDLLYKAIGGLFYGTYAIYLVVVNWGLFKYSRMIRDNYSALEKINLDWLRIFIFSLILLLALAGVCDVFLRQSTWDFVWLGSCVIIYLIGYFGFMQPEIFSSQDDNAPTDSAEVQEKETEKENQKYEKSSLTQELAVTYLAELQTAMKGKKIYLDKNINLSGLGRQLGISSHHLSQIINEQLGMNFYDYINSQRIAEAQKQLRDPNLNHQSIASIAFAVGFNSLSAFNAAFKKFAGKTPTQFRNEEIGRLPQK